MELVATAVLGSWCFHDHLTKLGWAGVGAAGLASVALSWSSGAAGFQAGGLVLLASFCWGLDNHFTAVIDGLTPTQSTFWKGLVAGTTNLAIGLGLESPRPALGAVLGALAVGGVCYGASIALYIRAAQLMGATRGQVVFASAPFLGVALSWLFLGDAMTLVHVVAAVGFLVAVGLLLAEAHSHEHEHPRLAHEHWHRHDDGHHTHVHPGLPPSTRHCHPHEHEPVRHRHPHWPDLHHRHRHDAEGPPNAQAGHDLSPDTGLERA